MGKDLDWGAELLELVRCGVGVVRSDLIDPILTACFDMMVAWTENWLLPRLDVVDNSSTVVVLIGAYNITCQHSDGVEKESNLIQPDDIESCMYTHQTARQKICS